MGRQKASKIVTPTGDSRKSRPIGELAEGALRRHQPSITAFFADASGTARDLERSQRGTSSDVSTSGAAKSTYKRNRTSEHDGALSMASGPQPIKQSEQAFNASMLVFDTVPTSTKSQAEHEQSATLDALHIFALPAAKRQKPPTRTLDPITATEDDVPQEGEEYVRPPGLEDGEDDDDFWENSSCSDSSSVTMAGDSVASGDEDANVLGSRTLPARSTAVDSDITCPICSMNLKQFSLSEAETHVNGCLDRDSIPRSSTTPQNGSHAEASRELCKRDIRDTSGSASKARLSVKSPNAQPSAFGALMKGKTEERAWKLSEQDTNHRRKGKMPAAQQTPARALLNVPFYKIMEGTRISVDAFKYGKIPNITAYFLSHAHADHYTRLSHNWQHGLIYCSQTTANLICHNLGVKKEWVRPLKDDEPTIVDGVMVTLLDANQLSLLPYLTLGPCGTGNLFLLLPLLHLGLCLMGSCPGSSMFLFEGVKQPQGKPFRYLHCGDFRASPIHLQHPALKGKKVDICYLDTTYLNPKFCFPAQEQVINACAELVKSRVLNIDKTALTRGKNHHQIDKNLARSGALLQGWLNSQSVTPKQEEKPIASPAKALIEAVKMENALQGKKEEIQNYPPIFRMSTKADSLKPKDDFVLVLIGTYTIGKERMVKQIAKSIGSKIYCDTRKSLIFKCIEDPELHSLMTDDPFKAQVHVTNLFAIKHEMLEDYLRRFRGHFTHSSVDNVSFDTVVLYDCETKFLSSFALVIGLRPTGWTYKPEVASTGISAQPSVTKVLEMFSPATQSEAGLGSSSGSPKFTQTFLYPQRDSTDRCQAFGVPYSEHSIIPTVNCGSAASRAKMKFWFERWQAERKRRIEADLPLFVQPRSESYW